MTKKVKTLPQYPSELIRVALDDLRKVEKDSRYKVTMSVWHRDSSNFNIPCEVCLAGSVIAKSLGANINAVTNPTEYPSDIDLKLQALDFFRSGRVSNAFKTLVHIGTYCEDDFNPVVGQRFDRIMSLYYNNSKQFHKDMRKLARDLEKSGY